jgi:hypothetical protein
MYRFRTRYLHHLFAAHPSRIVEQFSRQDCDVDNKTGYSRPVSHIRRNRRKYNSRGFLAGPRAGLDAQASANR